MQLQTIIEIHKSTVRKQHDNIKAIDGKHKYGNVGYALENRIITMEMVG